MSQWKLEKDYNSIKINLQLKKNDNSREENKKEEIRIKKVKVNPINEKDFK